MARTAEMFPKIYTPRRVLMHADDFGTLGDQRMAKFECHACGHKAGWLACTRSEERRGIPCPKCNAGQPGEKQ